ncbi:MAG: SusC/RagA family TonB-linked outer membrane protein [Bacteroidales bacterium]|nr:SusC/RagA family TonB-linked outer membrane protein [Bacteroidales bacterium]
MKKAKLFFSALFVLLAVSLSAQNVRVTGTVKDAQTGESVPFASIVVKGTTNGVSSDADGAYSITVSSNATLEISSVGYQTVDVAVAGKSVINVSLEPDFEALNETIIVAFGSTTKEAFTGSAAVVKSDELQKRTTANVTNALVGSVPGLQIKGASGAPGAGSGNINIRGLASVQASTDPLIIVDGAPYPASLTNIPSQDIESVTVLKDAASAALYGARGAAGVILVNTKRGRSSDARVNVDIRVGVNSRAVQDHDVITDPGEFYEAYYAQMYNYYYYSQGYTAAAANLSANNAMLNHLGYNVYTVPDGGLLIGSNGKLNPGAKLGRSYEFNGETYYMTPDNWRDLAYKNAVRQDYNVSIIGGTDRSSYYASIGYLNEDGIIEYSGYQRLTARVRADYQVKKWLKVGANVGFVTSETKSNPNMGTDLGSTNLMYYTTFIAPIYPVYVRVMQNGQPVIRTDEFGHEQYDYGVAATNYGVGRGFMQTGNPFGSNRYNTALSNGKQLNGTFTVDVDITPHLRANVTSTVNWGETLSTTYNNPYYGPKAGVNGELYKGTSVGFRTNNIQTLTYSNDFGRHYVNVMLGHEYYKTTSKNSGITAQGGFSPEVQEINAFANILYSGTTSSSSTYNTEGFFVSAQYDYAKKYYASASFRRDASSYFNKDHRWGNFWSVGGAWIISKEPFMTTASWVDQLKLKASVGQQGNDSIGAYNYVDTYSLSKQDDVTMVPTFRQLGNDIITWETTTNFNAGLEFSFWKGRLSGTLDGYYKKTANLLFWISIPESMGSRGYYGNIGDIANRGLELSLNVVPVRTRNVEWTIGGNISTNYAWILKLPESKMGENGGYYESGYWWTPGGVMRNYMNYEYAGVSDQGEALYWYDADLSSLGGKVATTVTNVPGKNHSGTTTHIGEATRYAQGSLLPKFFGGINTTLRLWDFDLSASFDYQIGGRITDNTYAQLMTPATSSSDGGYNYSRDYLRAWSPTNTSSNIPRWQYGDSDAAAGSSRWLTNASYINFQSFSVGYNVPVRRLGIDKYISRIRVYAVGENLGYISARKGFDPRASMSGTSTVNTYSPVRNISGGIQVTF